MLISAWPISVMPLKCSGGIRVLTDSMLPSLFTVSLQSHRWVLWACDSWRLIARRPAAVQIHAWMFSSLAPPATVVLEARLLNGCYKHIMSDRANARSCRSLHRLHTELKPPVPLPSCLLASPLCAVPTQGVSAPCFLRNDGSHYVSICCERLTPRELIPLSYMQFTYISLPWQAQMSHQKRILSPFSMAIRRYGPHRHSEDQISKLITFSKGTISLN